MNANDARNFIAVRLQPDVDPALDPWEVEQLVELAACVDEDDNAPTSDDWTPTYDRIGCYSAIAEGYTIKHGKAVGRVEFTTDSQTFRRQQLLDHLEHQRRTYAAKVSVTTNLGRP